MKHIVFFIAALALALGASAQTSLIATLSHEGEVTTYYNANAFIEAYDAAANGDIITLSAGTFAAPATIEKSLIIRGAGMMEEDDPTIITSNININLSSTEKTLSCEGVIFKYVGFTGSGSYNFTKCRIKELRALSVSSDVDFINCICDFYSINNSQNVTAVNSFFANGGYFHGDYSNCVLNFNSNSENRNASYTNCLFYSTNTKPYFVAGRVRNCIYIGENYDSFFNTNNISISTNNLALPTDTPIFKEGTNTYELTEENAANWLGNDGTQVGMHGGALPFDPNTTLPKITKFNVASKTTADGKLSVDIEVNVQ